ncbi:MAG TPA: phytase [Pyrinomonadaceae bacterium]|nr:phytase [Pyrinomonadaceae bacterium]
MSALLMAWSTNTDVVKPVAVSAPGRDVDSLAIWIAPKKEDSLVLMTEKAGGQVMVFKADRGAALVRRFGNIKRPNGLAVVHGVRVGAVARDLALVTDRDGNAVYVYSIPDFSLIGKFGEDLRQPMGISAYQRSSDSGIAVFVVVKNAKKDDKVIRFRLVEQGGKISGIREIQFGHEIAPGEESVVVDAERNLVFVADEKARDVKVYDTDGHWKMTIGRGHFQDDVEGLALAKCGDRRLLIGTDQTSPTEFEVFEFPDFKHVGTVHTTAQNTDGIALTQTALPDYPDGLFVAHSDPDGTGGRHAEFYDMDQILKSVGISCR